MTNGWVHWLDGGGQKKRISGVRGRRQITMDETISCLKAFPCCLCSTIHHPLRHGGRASELFSPHFPQRVPTVPSLLIYHKTTGRKGDGGGVGGLLCVLLPEDKRGKVLAEIQRHSCYRLITAESPSLLLLVLPVVLQPPKE